MPIDDKIIEKNCKMILKEKQQQYQNFRPEKLINMNILQVKK